MMGVCVCVCVGGGGGGGGGSLKIKLCRLTPIKQLVTVSAYKYRK